ncbi:MAG TPA: DUF2220 family protein [Candidatus Thiothrix moscowensis]|uniref:Wadjet anti-phage system protein JetD domain-containing protein n=1 Tax=unclassified Thiothrix TaxID=2636184 RepID=UPI0025D94B27|nr:MULTISPECIES: Wadjet anti-phage system protein JetD domain-containing protein [unclassified Thiothrix]HRJ52085.1 DUF2220 family protein [Candidatus Thiothrix moscowensis]HRJ92404.1 DUF2220 family protein [Candidatus Thiothrix moscowensis]
MITPADIRAKAQKLWDSGRILQDAWEAGELFPWEIPFRKPNAAMQVEQFAQVREWITALKQASREVKGYGYRIGYREVQHRQLGTQLLPDTLSFDTRDDLLRFIQKKQVFPALYQTGLETAAEFPLLRPWLLKYPTKLMEHATVWSALLAVCRYFLHQPCPERYLRELDIPSVDSKFIGQHKAILSELLDAVLPETAIDPDSSGLRQYGFERRYGLKYDEPLLRLRLLDAALSPVAGMTDISLPVSQLAQWAIPCQCVFVTENKTNGLSFPATAQAIVIFGLGYGVDTLAAIPWLHTRQVIYWGDLDTHGFSILSRMRRHFPHTQSLLMDAPTLQQYAHLCTEEPENARCADILQHLQPPEAAVYQQLQQTHQRLEQERIPMAYVQQQLARFNHDDDV